jgi:hypothetical protein
MSLRLALRIVTMGLGLLSGACSGTEDTGLDRQTSSVCLPENAQEGIARAHVLLTDPNPTHPATLQALEAGDRLEIEGTLSRNGGLWFNVRSEGGANGLVDSSGVTITRCRMSSTAPLALLMQRLGSRCASLGRGARCGIAVRDLVSGEETSYQGDESFISASSAKFIWVAAALHNGVAPQKLELYARDIFRYSNNDYPDTVIDWATGSRRGVEEHYDRMNDFYHDGVGMSDRSFYCQWHGRRTTHGKCTGAVPIDASLGWTNQDSDNFLTANDSIRFLRSVWDNPTVGGQPFLPAETRSTLLQWSTLTERWSAKYFPQAGTEAPILHHKPGRIPPDYVHGYKLPYPAGAVAARSPYETVNDIAIVELPTGQKYAQAYFMDYGEFYHEVPLAMYISCMIYHTILGDLSDPDPTCSALLL